MSSMHIKWIDNIRGLAFIGMVIHHIYYFYDVSHYTNFLSKNVEIIGSFSRYTFILLAGLSLYLSTKNNNFIKKRFNRSIKILIHAFIISLVTYYVFPNEWIRFGILHFMAVATLILVFIAPSPILLIIAFILFSIGIPKINNTIDVITGGSTPYSAVDWFPLNRYIPIMIGGVLIGHVLGDKLNFNIGSSKILEFIGNNSLELYTSHVLFLIGLNRFI